MKKPMTPFFLYRAEVYDEVKRQFPKQKITSLAKKIGSMWKSLSEEQKLHYQEKHIKHKEIY